MLDFLSVQPFSPQGALFAALFSAAMSHMGLRLGVLTRSGYSARSLDLDKPAVIKSSFLSAPIPLAIFDV